MLHDRCQIDLTFFEETQFEPQPLHRAHLWHVDFKDQDALLSLWATRDELEWHGTVPEIVTHVRCSHRCCKTCGLHAVNVQHGAIKLRSGDADKFGESLQGSMPGEVADVVCLGHYA